MHCLIFVAILCTVTAAPISIENSSEHEDNPQVPVIKTETPEESFLRSDANPDRILNFDEYLHSDLSYVQLKQAEFDEMDANSDGVISAEEYGKFYDISKNSNDETNKYYAGIFKEFDKNMDKKMSESELKRVLSKRFFLAPKDNFGELFAGFDADKDGSLNLAEYGRFDQEFPFHELEPTRVIF
uniref:EF hand n=1 Tax=Panagrellus redivivus TaxID=6233 RepID=A0A7E4ZYJ6_PANRE